MFSFFLLKKINGFRMHKKIYLDQKKISILKLLHFENKFNARTQNHKIMLEKK